MNKRGIISKNYLNFCKAEGNQHIASEFAVLKLQELIESFQVKKILKLVLGLELLPEEKVVTKIKYIYRNKKI